MTRRQVVVPADLRWDEPMVRAFSETAPYRIVPILLRISDREILFEDEAGFEDGFEELVIRLIRELAGDFRDATETMLRIGNASAPSRDTHSLLIAKGDIVETAPGAFAYRGDFVTVMRLVESAVSRFAASCNALEEQYPTTVSLDILNQVGYLSLFPQHLFFAAPLRKNLGGLESIRGGEGLVADPLLQAPTAVLNTTVCHHTFQVRKGQIIETPAVVTATGSCHRYEAGSFVDGIRLGNFRMREIVFLGSQPAVSEFLQKCIAWFEALIDDLGLQFRVVEAIDPFFGESGGRRLLQAGLSLKTELRVLAAGQFVAAGSANNHRQSFSRSLDIRSKTGEVLTSGCFGVGIDRFSLALFDRYGTSLDDWGPKPLAALSR